MAWIELHDTLSNHKKTYALADRLKIKQYAAVGILVTLWTWALNNAQDGDLSDLPDTAIAHACFWDKKPSDFVAALKETGWIDNTGRIHDWYEYAGRLIEKRAEDAERKKKSRASVAKRKPTVRRTSSGHSAGHSAGHSTGHDADKNRTSSVTVPKPYLNRTVHNQDVVDVDVERAREDDSGGGFLAESEMQPLADGIHSVLDAAKRAGFPDTQADWDKCNNLVADYGPDAVLAAISVCTDRPMDKRNYGYLAGVLGKDPKGGKLPDKPISKPGKGYYNPFYDLAKKYEEEGV